MTARRWAFTFNLKERPTTINQYLQEWNLDKVKYILYQLEKAPTTGTYHLQGCISLKDPAKMTGVKKIFNDDTVHVEKAKHWDKLKDYCKKQDTKEMDFIEWGKESEQGKRTDLDALAATIKEGTTLSTIADTQPGMFIKYHKGLQALRSALMKPKAMERKVMLCWGKTGTGKTRLAYDAFDHTDIYSVFCIKNPWFDGYDGHKVVLFDECGPGMMNHNFLKRVLDRHPMTVPVKGGSMPWNAETIILTSNLPIDWWFQIPTEDMAALKRRMVIFEFPQEAAAAKAYLTGDPAWESVKRVDEVREPEAKRRPIPTELLAMATEVMSDSDREFVEQE